MKHHPADRAAALAGVFQSAVLVDDLAWTGRGGGEATAASLASVVRVDAGSVAEVYGGLANLATGLRALRAYLRRDSQSARGPVAYYVAALLHLERRIARSREMEDALAEGVRIATRQSEHFAPDHDNVVASLADLYSRTAGAAGPRIMVRGEPEMLRSPHIAHRIRALLLAGIRSARLWHQCGGRRLGLLFGRRRLAEATEQLLAAAGDVPST